MVAAAERSGRSILPRAECVCINRELWLSVAWLLRLRCAGLLAARAKPQKLGHESLCCALLSGAGRAGGMRGSRGLRCAVLLALAACASADYDACQWNGAETAKRVRCAIRAPRR